jgi:hypothetical protein
MRCIQLTGSDDRMDCRDMFYDPLNPLPPKCKVCGFPDLDHVPQPYYLVKSRTMSPNELAPAANGNFLIRPRIATLLKAVAPKQCSFFPTCYKGTSERTPWLLAVPVHQVVTAKVKASIARCKKCKQPRSAHPGTQYEKWLWNSESKFDVLKSSTWGSSELGWDKWISRDLFMSVRLFHLLQAVKAKGLDEVTCDRTTSANNDESRWVDKHLELLKTRKIPLQPAGALSDDDTVWFKAYLKANRREAPAKIDFKAAEKVLKFKLPKSYVDFVAKVGPRAFQNVDDSEGFTVQVLPPAKFDAKTYRAGALECHDDESNAVNGVMFASSNSGDCFCFDVRRDRKELQVFWYKHEYNYFEPYAENFAACIKRFASG